MYRTRLESRKSARGGAAVPNPSFQKKLLRRKISQSAGVASRRVASVLWLACPPLLASPPRAALITSRPTLGSHLPPRHSCPNRLAIYMCSSRCCRPRPRARHLPRCSLMRPAAPCCVACIVYICRALLAVLRRSCLIRLAICPCSSRCCRPRARRLREVLSPTHACAPHSHVRASRILCAVYVCAPCAPRRAASVACELRICVQHPSISYVSCVACRVRLDAIIGSY